MYTDGPEGSKGGKGSQTSLRPSVELPHWKADTQQLAKIVTQAASQPAIPRMANAGGLAPRSETHAKHKTGLKATKQTSLGTPSKHPSSHIVNVLHAKIKNLSLSLAD